MNFRHCEKSIIFEISLGNAGNSTDGFLPLESYADLSILDDTDGNFVNLIVAIYLIENICQIFIYKPPGGAPLQWNIARLWIKITTTSNLEMRSQQCMSGMW